MSPGWPFVPIKTDPAMAQIVAATEAVKGGLMGKFPEKQPSEDYIKSGVPVIAGWARPSMADDSSVYYYDSYHYWSADGVRFCESRDPFRYTGIKRAIYTVPITLFCEACLRLKPYQPDLFKECGDGNFITDKAIASVVSPDAPVTTNEHGGSQSHIPVRFDLIDAKALFAAAAVLNEGAEKYSPGNWRLIPVRDHLNHLLMHTYAYLSGDRTDDHLSHALCRAIFALGVELDPDGTPEKDQ